MTKALIIAAMLALAGADAAAAATQSPATVGELLDGGGKQLTGGEIAKLFAGATIGGPALNQPDVKFQVKYLTNGTAAGEIASAGGSTQLTGTWSANRPIRATNTARICAPPRACRYWAASTISRSATGSSWLPRTTGRHRSSNGKSRGSGTMALMFTLYEIET